MKLYAQALARRLHEQRISHPTDAASQPQSAEWPGYPERPRPPEMLQNVAGCSTGSDVAPSQASREVVEHADAAVAPTNGSPAPSNAPTRVRRLAERVKPLSQAQQVAIDLLVLGQVDQAVADHLGLHRMTINRWRLYNPAFRAELARRRQEAWGTAVDRFRMLLDGALGVLGKQLANDAQDVSFRAASRLLELAHRFEPPDEPTDVEGVLTHEARKLNVELHELHPGRTVVYEDERERALQLMAERAGEELTTDADPPSADDAVKADQI